MPIDTIEDLHSHLGLAIRVELATIPPYLYAMYSVEDRTSPTALMLKSIVVEEMLHAVLVTNLLLAVGGKPSYHDTGWIPTYPMLLPHHKPPLTLELAPLSIDLVQDVFMRIEQPEEHEAPAQPDEFETLGQFYHAVENGLRRLSSEIDLFAEPQLEKQMSDEGFYAPVEYDAADSGGLIAITDLDSALEAIEIIVHQGEGLATSRWADPDHQELTHYYKLLEIIENWDSGAGARPLPKNPLTMDYPESLQPVSVLFNASYRYLFVLMGRIFSGSRPQPPLVGHLYVLMKTVLGGLATYLTSGDHGHPPAAPTFEIHEFESDHPDAELARLANDALRKHTDLAQIVDIIGRWAAAEEADGV